MRPPLSAIEPFSRGVSIATRGRGGEHRLARLQTWPARRRLAPGTCGAPRLAGTGGCRRGGVGARRWPGSGPAAAAAAVAAAACWRCFSICGMPKKNCHADQHDRRQHDREDGVLLVGHCVSRSADRCAGAPGRLRAAAWTRFSAVELGDQALERQARARPGGRSAHSHARLACRIAADSRTTSRSRRRTRLRSTALPTFFETVKPTRDGPSSSRARACRTKRARPGTLGPCGCGEEIRALLQPLHARRLPAPVRRSAACARAPAAWRAPCGRPWSPCGRGSRAGACAPVCSVDRSVSRVTLSAGRGLVA